MRDPGVATPTQAGMLQPPCMEMLEAVGPNAEQIRYWNELAGPKWVAHTQIIDKPITSLGLRAMERAAIAPGERVLEVGCGCGTTTLEIARRVGTRGAVTGVDISTVMLEKAQQIMRDAGVTNVRFENADAQTHPFAAASFDVVFSRFGVMFFTDPDAAFANLRAALRPGGRLAFVCWQALEHNEWMLVPLAAALQHVPPPPLPPPGAPGPFSFADPERVRGILSRAGFVDIACDAVTEVLTLDAGGLDQTIDFILQMGPTGHLLREASPHLLPLVADAVRTAVAPFVTPDGVRMSSAAWIVSAHT